jgi:hypothetical protein
MKINWTTGEFDPTHPLWVVWYKGVPGEQPTLSIIQAGIASAWRTHWLEAAKQGFPRVWAPMGEVITALDGSAGADGPALPVADLEAIAAGLKQAASLSLARALALENIARGQS